MMDNLRQLKAKIEELESRLKACRERNVTLMKARNEYKAAAQWAWSEIEKDFMRDVIAKAYTWITEGNK